MKTNSLVTKQIISIVFGILLCSCSDKDDIPVAETEWDTQKIAVVLPMGDGLDVHWKRTLRLLDVNLKTAFANQKEGVTLEFEWYDENATYLRETAETLSTRKDIIAVIGGRSSSAASILAKELCLKGKAFFTLATSEELMRGYAKEQTLWTMIEPDISQCEVLLTRVLYYGAKNATLLADGNSPYGKTFINWFGFQAKELGLNVKAVCDYQKEDIDNACRKAYASKADYVVCTPSNKEEMKRMLQQHRLYAEENGTAPRLLFGDTGYGSDVINQLGELTEGIEGVSYGSNPESGFDVSYEVYYDEPPTIGESQLYDAAMLIAFAAYKQILNPQLDFTTAMRQLVDGREEGHGSWMARDMQEVVEALTQDQHPDINGASGSLNFDSKVYTSVLSTVYHSYSVYNGKYIILDHSVNNGSRRLSDTLAGWNWKATQMQDLDESETTITYPPLDKRWALLVAGSGGWSNYRHQADVLNMYQILKTHGYTDERIILIVEDDIAYHKYNPRPGFISTRPDGENLYDNIHIDYHTRDLTPADIKHILCGERNERLQEVIDSDFDDNVLVFWSGHGTPGEFCWLDELEGFSAGLARQTFQKMHDTQRYRKLLCLIETCYSGSVMNKIEGIEGILAITAASSSEKSNADVYNPSLGIWMSNRFTSTLLDCITKDANIPMRNLYYRLFKNTIGSHVMIYNSDYYGNLYTNTMNEFI